MSRVEVFEVQNNQDAWSKMYGYLAKGLVKEFGLDGEQALREGIRKYGSHRGRLQRERHMAVGLKPNLLNLFTYGDVPTHKANPNFKRNKIKLTEQERLSETLCCPISEVWKSMGIKQFGRIYCEEFHHAKFGTYNTKAQINLSQTLTQEGDDYCRFSIYLRPGNMNEEERKETFPEFDKDYTPVENPVYKQLSFEDSIYLLYYYIVNEAIKKLGNKVLPMFADALEEFAQDFANQLQKHAKALGVEMTDEFLSKNSPFTLSQGSKKTGVWLTLVGEDEWNLFITKFYPAYHKALKL